MKHKIYKEKGAGMNKVIEKFEIMKSKTSGYWSERILSQLAYGMKLSKVNDGRYDSLIKDAVESLYKRFTEDGTITKHAALEAESVISSLSEAAKKYKIICAAHAHIDMNWVWSYAETVAVTLDTFRTMLDLMKEYPDFTYSQSQASVYRIVEEFDPCMLEEIKARVKEGRWEVTASTWVETDKNMPNGESLARHILNTKRYLSHLLDICPGSLKIDFEPDTFGHNINVPEILANGGIKYYYHCRGYDKHYIFKWQSPSGKSILVYREPFWYNARIEPSMVLYVPEFCEKYGLDTMLKVYGVGNHGGGPTRQDIERIIDMDTWPVFPGIKFGTFAEYFGILEKISGSLPVVTDELNYIFTGCYTSQSRIKMANRVGEAKLNEAEAFSAISTTFAGGRYRGGVLASAWEKVLFNHFHDILPGSGVIDTREYAMGQFQQVLAATNTEISAAFRNIASQVDTSGLLVVEDDTDEINETTSEGAGVGFGIKDFGVPQAERGKGKRRIFHFFNPSAGKRKEPVEIIVWDWPGDIRRIVIKDKSGVPVRYQILKKGNYQKPGESYWGHTYIRILVDAEVPAYGYTTYILSEGELYDLPVKLERSPRVDEEDVFVLENDHIKVCFDTSNASIISLKDKKCGKEMVPPGKPAGIFRLVEEDDVRGMTSWRVGRYMNVYNLNELHNVKVNGSYIDKSALRQWISYSIEFGDSKLNVTVHLDYNSPRLNYTVECDWQERPVRGKFVPQLNFYVPLNYKCRAYRYDVPFGTIDRPAMDMDVPANSWMAGIPEDGDAAVMLVTSTKYGFRGYNNSMAVSLIRSSYDPDPYPELGIHKFSFALDVAAKDSCGSTVQYLVEDSQNTNQGDLANCKLIRRAFEYNHPVHFISGRAHKGILPLEGSFISLESGTVTISAIKVPEAGDCGKQERNNRYESAHTGGYCLVTDKASHEKRLIIRVYETDGEKTRAVVKFAGKVSRAWFTDINEKPLKDADTNTVSKEAGKDEYDGACVEIDNDRVIFDVDAYSIATICVEFC
ncbi:MAG: alpha-mannosidase [Clostridiaceae bacterium]|nr:alpha-mannosidase [Clostridiaceae bacterium]